MGRLGVTYIDVDGAIAVLQGQNRASTVDNIREVLGTGSKSTIARLLREWKAQRGLSFEDTAILPNDLLTTVKELWSRLQTKANGTIDSHKQEYDTALHEIQQQLNQYKAKDTEWQKTVHSLEEQLHQQIENNKHLNAAFIAERQEKIKANERIEAMQSRHQESQSENGRLHQLLNHVQANLEHYQAATQQLRLEQEIIVEKQRADYEQRLLRLQQQIEVMIREKTFLEARCAGLDRDYNAVLARETAVTKEAEELRRKQAILEANYSKLEQNLREVSEELIAQRQALENRNHELIECQLKREIAENHRNSLQKNLAAAEDKIVVLRDDYLFVSQEREYLKGQVKQLQTITIS